jgi:hypothetical protein
MAISATIFPDSQPFSRATANGGARAPLSIYLVLFASLSVILGVIWDGSGRLTGPRVDCDEPPADVKRMREGRDVARVDL